MFAYHKANLFCMGLFSERQVVVNITDLSSESVVVREKLGLPLFGCFKIEKEFICTLLELREGEKADTHVLVLVDKVLDLQVAKMDILHAVY